MTKFIALASGKGGVGKTTATLNLGQALVNIGSKVTLLDANLVTPNLAIKLGFMDPQNTLNHFLRKQCGLNQVIYKHESGISLVPASPSYSEFQKTNPQHLGKIFDQLEDTTDFVLVDAPSGLGYEVSQVLKHCDETIVVVNPNLSSVMDALKTIKLAKAHNTIIAGVVVNMSHGGRHELSPSEIQDILGYPLLGNIKYDKKVRKSLHKQLPLTYLYPKSRSAKQFKAIAEHISHIQ